MSIWRRFLLFLCFIAQHLGGQTSYYGNGELVKGTTPYDNREFITETPLYDKDELLTILLRLHRSHCGDTAMCNVSDESHVEPWVTMFPRPCCTPCSCLPSCDEGQNCCHERGNLRITTFTETVTTPFSKQQIKPRDERERIAREGSLFTQTDGRSDSISLNTSGTSLPEPLRDRAESAQKTIITETIVKTTTSHLKSDSIGDSSVNIPEKQNVEMACIRPQLFYNPNSHPDSVACKMVVSCPPGFPDASRLAKCKAGQGNENIADIIPITSKLSGLTYINKHCLFCNEPHQQYTPSRDEWEIQLIDQNMPYRHWSIKNPQSVMSLPRFHFFNVHFLPKTSSSAQKCIIYDVSSCNQTGLLKINNKTLELVCRRGDHLPVTHTVNGRMLLFKNIACVHCNSPTGFVDNPLACAYSPDIQSHLQTLTISFHSLASYSTLGLENIKTTYIEASVLEKFQGGSCRQGFLVILGRCRRIVCPKDHYLETNRCVPLYRSLTGLYMNFKLKITPMQDIKRSKAQHVGEKLKALVNNSLDNSVSLHIREIYVWYLPKGNMKVVAYYLFDMFLYNVTDEITYSQALRELHDFYYSISSLTRLEASDSLNSIELQYGIGHGLDVTYQGMVGLDSQMGIKNLIKIGDEFKLEPLVNHVAISDINWCIRTEFTGQEMKLIGRPAQRITLTNTILFKDQFDLEIHRGSITLYTCIKYFIDDMEIDRGQTKSSTNIVDIREDLSDTTYKTSLLTEKGFALTVLGFVFLLTGFILIKAKTCFTKRQSCADDHSDVSIETSNDIVRYSVHDLCNRSGIPGNQTVAVDDGGVAENIGADGLIDETKEANGQRIMRNRVEGDVKSEENMEADNDKIAKEKLTDNKIEESIR